MEWTPSRLRVLRQALAAIYPRDRDQRAVVRDLALPEARIAFSDVAEHTWLDIIEKSKLMGKIDTLLGYALQDAGKGNAALENLQAVGLDAAREEPRLRIASGSIDARRFERIVGERSSLVAVRYLMLGAARARSVARVDVAGVPAGTGFLIPGDLLVTNNHVIASADKARGAKAVFDYEETAPRSTQAGTEIPLDPDRFFKTSPRDVDDWTVVAVPPGTTERFGAIPMEPRTIKPEDFVNILQHPGGGPKKVSLTPRVVVRVADGKLLYLTDTEPGSSGSPVFDQEWNLVALHHGWSQDPVYGASGAPLFPNEGILIERILDGLARR